MPGDTAEVPFQELPTKGAHRDSIFEEPAAAGRCVTECKFREMAIANGHAAAKLSDRGRFFGLDPNSVASKTARQLWDTAAPSIDVDKKNVWRQRHW